MLLFNLLIGLLILPIKYARMTASDAKREKVNIGDNQAWKIVVTNYYIKDDFFKIGSINGNLN